MNLSKWVLMAMVVLGSGAAFAEGGAERSQAFWAEFRKSQERVHGQGKQEVAQKEVEQKVAKD